MTSTELWYNPNENRLVYRTSQGQYLNAANLSLFLQIDDTYVKLGTFDSIKNVATNGVFVKTENHWAILGQDEEGVIGIRLRDLKGTTEQKCDAIPLEGTVKGDNFFNEPIKVVQKIFFPGMGKARSFSFFAYLNLMALCGNGKTISDQCD